MTVVRLEGCHTEPLGSYLKGLGVLRIVSDQVDAEAAAAWSEDTLLLRSTLSKDELVEFFLKRYSPLPAVSPWRLGSGFYPGDNRTGIDQILKADDPRFNELKNAIKTVLGWPEFKTNEPLLGPTLTTVENEYRGKQSKKAEEALRLVGTARRVLECLDEQDRKKLEQTPISALKPQQLRANHNLRAALTSRLLNGDTGAAVDAELKLFADVASKLRTEANRLLRSDDGWAIRRARNELSDRALAWVDCAVFLGSSGEPLYPPLVGTGGNEGKLDYSNQFHRLVAEVLTPGDPCAQARSRSLLLNALFGELCSDLVEASAAQFDPGRAGGFNQGPEFETKQPPLNPWDYILALEGAVLWTSGLARRSVRSRDTLLTSPFTVSLAPGAVASLAPGEESNIRAEIWAPIWPRFATCREVSALFREGRIMKGWQPVRNGRDFAEALAALGTDRGLAAFRRYLLAKRRGDSYVALPSGCLTVRAEPATRLLWELDGLLQQLDQFVGRFRDSKPALLVSLRRRLEDSIFEALVAPQAETFTAVLKALGRLERWIGLRDPKRDPKLWRPFWGLSSRWLEAANDGSPEFQLAASLAGLGHRSALGPLRRHWSPVNAGRLPDWDQPGPQLCWQGATAVERMVNALRWRLQNARAISEDELARQQSAVVFAPLAAVAAFIGGRTNLNDFEDLLFGLSLLDWQSVPPAKAGVLFESADAAGEELLLPRAYALLKLFFTPRLPRCLGIEKEFLPPPPSLLPLLAAGRINDAVELARRHLFAAGLNPVRIAFPETGGMLLAAALLFPVKNIRRLAKLVLHEEA